jgi:DNA-binding HxlR family transcriptional regulator
MDESYGQYCAVARSAEVLCERWTPLVVRELLCGSKRFNDLHRGVPRMSTSLLTQRLRHLEDAGIVRRQAVGKVWEYQLTDAGEALRPVVMGLGHWGARWVAGRLRDEELDPALLMWDMRRFVRLDQVPPYPVVVHFHFSDARPNEQLWWLVIESGRADLCLQDPGRDLTLVVNGTVRALTEVWVGDRTPAEVLRAQDLRIDGPPREAERLWAWLGTSLFAPSREVARAQLTPAAGDASGAPAR